MRFLQWVNQGRQLQLQGEHARAVQDYTRAISLAPRQARGYLSRAGARSRVGSDQEAVEDYIVALVLSRFLASWSC